MAASLTTAATATSNVGSYAINASGTAVTSAAHRGYRIVLCPGTLTVTPRALTITADGLSRDANPALTYALGGLGLVNGVGSQGPYPKTRAQPANLATTPSRKVR